MRKSLFLGLLLAVASVSSSADVSESDLGELKGYTILGSFEVTGWRDPDIEGLEGKSFNGCKRNRILILDNKFEVRCDEYNYAYAYRPTAVILGNGESLKMIVEGYVYSIKK